MLKSVSLRLVIGVLMLCGMIGGVAVQAQDSLDSQPLIKMLSQVPDNVVTRSEIYFNDRKAVELAYPTTRMPKDWAEFKSLGQANDPALLPVDLWWRVWRNQSSALMGQNLMVSDKMPDAVGFDFFAVQQELSYGRPPLQTLMLNGTFNLDAVRAALTAHDFSRQDQSGVEVWCGADGCDKGAKVNVQDRNPANPFGGDLGRKWPTIVQAGQLVGSPSLKMIELQIAVQQGTASSLGSAPEYRAAVDALSKNGVLMQAYFWDGEVLAAISQVDRILGRARPDARKKLIEALLKDYEPLPAFKLLGFGDAASESEQIGEVALVYSSEADALQAAAILPKRIATYISLAVNRPFIELLAERGVTTPLVNVVNSNGQFVVVITLATPKPSLEQLASMTTTGENPSGVTPPGIIYRLLFNAATRQDLGWLSSITREALEAAAK